MKQIGFSAWFGPLAEGDDAATQFHEAITGLGFERQGIEPSLLSGVVEFQYGTKSLEGNLPIVIGHNRTWGRFSLYPVTEEVRAVFGDERIRVLLRQLSDKLQVVLGRTYGESQLGVVYESELQGGPEWLDWFQYWGPTIVGRWGIERIKAGPFRLVEPTLRGACAITLFKNPEDPEQMPLQAKGAEYLGIRLRTPLRPL